MCDKHVPKMVLESAQLLCNAHPTAPYKHTHLKHPCTKWVLESKANYKWLLSHAFAIAEQYEIRFNKTHKTKEVLKWLNDNEPVLPDIHRTPFALAMPDQYKLVSEVDSYRNYYIQAKAHLAKWNKGVPQPHWFRPDYFTNRTTA
jgi:hypothetical protein